SPCGDDCAVCDADGAAVCATPSEGATANASDAAAKSGVFTSETKSRERCIDFPCERPRILARAAGLRNRRGTVRIHYLAPRLTARRPLEKRDRKSTRLNSSHYQ